MAVIDAAAAGREVHDHVPPAVVLVGRQVVAFLLEAAADDRAARDLERLLWTQAGWSANTPLSIADGPSSARACGRFDPKTQRIGWLADLDGHLALEPGILDACAGGLRRLEGLGCAVEPARLGMPPARVWDAWLVWRRVLVASRLAPLLQ